MINFILNKVEHACGDRKCLECYRGYPMNCACGKGLIHAQFIKETWQNIVELAHSCDVCGDNYKFIGVTARPVRKNYKRRTFNKPK